MPLINFAGIASGIDSNALIDAISASYRAQRITPSENKIAETEETNSAYEELKEKLEALRLQILEFATLNGGALKKTATSNDETVLTGSASSAAQNGSYSVTVTQLAKNHTHSFNDSFTGSSDLPFPAAVDAAAPPDADVIYYIGTGADQVTIDVTVTSTMTIGGFVTAFNDHPSNNGRATATLVQVAPGDYRVMVNSNFEGTAKGIIHNGTPPPEANPGPLVGATIQAIPLFTTSTNSIATDAEFTVGGILDPFTRSSNNVTDVISGLTLNLQSLGTATITIGDDVAGTTARVQDIVDSFNEIVQFVSENNLISREEEGEDVETIFGPLAASRIDDNAITAIKAAISGSTHSGGSAVKIFADLGITTDRDGTLKFDTDKFAEAIADESSSVNQILMNFGDDAGTTTGLAIYQFTRANGLIDVTVNSNKQLISDLNDRIAQAEAQLAKQQETLRARFARLEGLIGQLQSQQNALNSALAGLGTGN